MALDGIVYVNDHPAPRNAGKGSPLTVDEADDNFFELYTRLKALETSPPTAVSISNIAVNGSQLLITLTDASTFGPFTLPIAKLNFRGDYIPGMILADLDLIDVPNQGLFMTLVANTDTDDPFNPDAVDGSGNKLFTQVFGADTLVYDVGFFYPGKPGIGIQADGYMFAHKFVRATTIAAGLVGSEASLRIACSAALSFPLYGNGTLIGSIDFASGASTPTFTFASDVAFAVGDEIQVGPPVAIDLNARDLQLTLLFNRV